MNPKLSARVRAKMRAALAGLVLSTVAAAASAEGGVPVAAGGDCAGRVAAALQRRYESVRDLSARFDQSTRSASLGGPGSETKSRGRLLFAKPGRMRWTYEEPEPSLVVSDGKRLWIYDPGHHEVQQLSVTEGYLSGAAVSFLFGQGEILRDFEIRALACGDAEATLELVPKQPATYEKLRARIDPRSGELIATTVIDLLGNATTVALHETRVNQDPAAELFRFEVPQGVQVIDLDAAAGRP
jgi:outer membrane lipoprotein carrier protein